MGAILPTLGFSCRFMPDIAVIAMYCCSYGQCSYLAIMATIGELILCQYSAGLTISK